TPDGRHVLITDLDAGELLVLDTQTHKQIKAIKVGKGPEGILMVPDGSRAYVAVAGDNFLAVLDLKTWEITGRINTGTGPDGMAWAVRR
ncbi:MAG TPA: YncE family protein, partial [Blastocatellia bacterium]|nr:YncE family protein [Blastocatellia bacterium]